MSTSTTLMTAEELLQLPSGQYRYELINGELKTMSPSGHNHGRITVRLTVPLASFVWDNDLGEVFGTETGFKLTTQPDTVLAPDISFIEKSRMERAKSSEGYWEGPPDLAVEFLSPGDRKDQVAKKASQWLSFGAKLVWVVDPRTRTVVVYESGSDVLNVSEGDFLDGGDVVSGFKMAVGKIFDR